MRKEQLITNLSAIKTEIAVACKKSGRELDDICLIAVSKGHGVEDIQILYDEGVRDFGESYVPELLAKQQSLPDDIRWHFIGRLQSNKARHIADSVLCIHSIDRDSLIKKLEQRSLRPVNILLQVNISGEKAKGGIDVNEIDGFLDKIQAATNLRLRGLMTMPPYSEKPEASRIYFQQLNELFERCSTYLRENYPEKAALFTHLSMGMSNDYAVAIEEGATLIRVGTQLFGKRQK